MEYTRLGNTGLNVSRICFGCMWFGKPGNGGIEVKWGEDQAREVIRYAWELAERHGVSTSVIAQAWNLSKPVVTSPLIGASKTTYVDDAVAALDLHLTSEERAYLEEPYVPHAQYGFR